MWAGDQVIDQKLAPSLCSRQVELRALVNMSFYLSAAALSCPSVSKTSSKLPTAPTPQHQRQLWGNFLSLPFKIKHNGRDTYFCPLVFFIYPFLITLYWLLLFGIVITCVTIVLKIIRILVWFRVIIWSFLFGHCVCTCWSSGELYPEHNEEKISKLGENRLNLETVCTETNFYLFLFRFLYLVING